MSRTLYRALLAVAWIAASGAAGAGEAPSAATRPSLKVTVLDDPDEDAGAGADAAAWKALKQRLPRFELDAVPLERALASLAAATGSRISPEWRDLEPAGVTPKSPVTVRLHGVPGSQALAEILEGVAGKGASLGWTLDDGVIVVSARDAIARRAVTRAYTVNWMRPGARQEWVDDLLTLVQAVVAPETWAENGSGFATARVVNDELVVTQTRENQRRVAGLLEQLHETRTWHTTLNTCLLTVIPARLPEEVRSMLRRRDANAAFTDAKARVLVEAARHQVGAAIVPGRREVLLDGRKVHLEADAGYGAPVRLILQSDVWADCRGVQIHVMRDVAGAVATAINVAEDRMIVYELTGDSSGRVAYLLVHPRLVIQNVVDPPPWIEGDDSPVILDRANDR
jgi:hypothetical protein